MEQNYVTFAAVVARKGTFMSKMFTVDLIFGLLLHQVHSPPFRKQSTYCMVWIHAAQKFWKNHCQNVDVGPQNLNRYLCMFHAGIRHW